MPLSQIVLNINYTPVEFCACFCPQTDRQTYTYKVLKITSASWFKTTHLKVQTL